MPIRTIEIGNRVVVTLSRRVDAILDYTAVELLILGFYEMHRASV